MSDKKYSKIYIDWWRIQSSSVRGIVIFAVFAFGLLGVSWWAMKSDWLVNTEISESPKDSAIIFSFEGDVRVIRAATRETIVVTRQTYAAPGDTIQTQADGRAVVRMIDGSTYTVRPNSTVVIRDSTSLFGGRNVRVALDDGQVNVRTEEQHSDVQNVVEMQDSETRLRSQTEASFNADRTSGSSEIRISRGSVETTVSGSQTTITENQFARVNDGKISEREKLILPPRLASPANGAQIVDPGNGASATFVWQDDSGSGNFYIQVARSPYFAPDSILVDRSGLNVRDFRLTGVAPGTYYWRIRSTVRSGQTSEWSEPSRFSVVRGQSSAAIDVQNWNVERVGGNVYIISGKALPGLLVRSQGREVYAGSDGAFRLQVSSGSSEINVEFSDDRGNRAGFVLSLRNSRVLRRY
jgi:hypothetical protein